MNDLERGRPNPDKRKKRSRKNQRNLCMNSLSQELEKIEEKKSNSQEKKNRSQKGSTKSTRKIKEIQACTTEAKNSKELEGNNKIPEKIKKFRKTLPIFEEQQSILEATKFSLSKVKLEVERQLKFHSIFLRIASSMKMDT